MPNLGSTLIKASNDALANAWVSLKSLVTPQPTNIGTPGKQPLNFPITDIRSPEDAQLGALGQQPPLNFPITGIQPQSRDLLNLARSGVQRNMPDFGGSGDPVENLLSLGGAFGLNNPAGMAGTGMAATPVMALGERMAVEGALEAASTGAPKALRNLSELLHIPTLSAKGSQATIQELIQSGAAKNMEPESVAQILTRKFIANPKKADLGYENASRVFTRSPTSPPDAPPQYFVGKPKNASLVRMAVNNLTPEETLKAANWWPDFTARLEASVAPEDVKPAVNAWILSQRGDSPARGLANTQIAERVANFGPQAEPKLAGMGNEQLVDIFKGVLPEQGISRKIGDMGDLVRKSLSEEHGGGVGGPPRTEFPDILEGPGSLPSPSDRHMARAAGYVDTTVLDKLKRWYPDDAAEISNLVTDMPSQGNVPDALYEPTAQVTRDLVPYLNKHKFQGKTDWDVDQVQPVLWTAYKKMIGQTPGSPEEAFNYNMANLPMEVAPSPNSPHTQILPDLGGLTATQSRKFTNKFNAWAVNKVSPIVGSRPLDMVEAEGGWKPPGKQLVSNPNNVVTVMATPSALGDTSHAVSAITGQDTIPVYKIPYSGDPESLPTKFANVAERKSYTEGSRANSTGIKLSSDLFSDRNFVKKFSAALYALDPAVKGHTLINEGGQNKILMFTTDPVTGDPTKLSTAALVQLDKSLENVMGKFKMPDNSLNSQWMGVNLSMNQGDHFAAVDAHIPGAGDKLREIGKTEVPDKVKALLNEIAPGYWDAHFKARPFNQEEWSKLWDPAAVGTGPNAPVVPPTAPVKAPKQAKMFGSSEEQ